MFLDKKTEELFTKIREKCQERGWFGADMWMDFGASNRPSFQTAFPPVATREQVEQIEQQLGFPLPDLLRDLYLHLANGNICFGYGILSCEELLQEYQSAREETYLDGTWRWPEKLIPLCYWGCTLYSYLDTDRGTILFTDLEGLSDGAGDFLVEASSLSAWFERWLTQQKEGNRADDEGDPQLRAMHLEKWEDDPRTPVPPYVTAYRQLVNS